MNNSEKIGKKREISYLELILGDDDLFSLWCSAPLAKICSG